LTPGTLIQPLDLWRAERIGGNLLLDRGDLLVEEVDLAQAAVDRLAFLNRQFELAQPAATGEAE
jgi:hypothetical protein